VSIIASKGYNMRTLTWILHDFFPKQASAQPSVVKRPSFGWRTAPPRDAAFFPARSAEGLSKQKHLRTVSQYWSTT
jgi:hypothetical protein